MEKKRSVEMETGPCVYRVQGHPKLSKGSLLKSFKRVYTGFGGKRLGFGIVGFGV